MILSPHIWYPESYPERCFDLRQVLTWVTDGDTALVRFKGEIVSLVLFNRLDFEAAMTRSVNNTLQGLLVPVSIDSAEAFGNITLT